MYLETKGDLLTHYKTNYLVHQCNCKTTTSIGLANTIFRKFPNTNTYSGDHIRNPGEIDIIKPIINLYGQIFPGRANAILDDSREDRLNYFKQGLTQIYQELDDVDDVDDLETINLAFPKYIGCGLAGWVWDNYEKALKEFETKYSKVNILIVDFN